MDERLRLALLGDPVDHSRSPAIHRSALAEAGLEGDYVAIRADRTRLEEALGHLRAGDLDGFNVTMPLKGAAAELCDTLTREAEKSGSVNSIRLVDGLVEGHSTDVVAFEEIFASGPFAGLERIHILGSGGSARAALAGAGWHEVSIAARSPDRAHRLTRDGGARVVAWGDPVEGAILANATPLGMNGETLPHLVLESAGALVDLPYGPDRTPAVVFADEQGIPVVDGLEFVARQAVAAFRWWTGRSVDLDRAVAVARNV